MGGGTSRVDVHVGARMRFRRMMVGMSQDTLGKQIGVTFQQIQKYEKGLNRIGAGRLYEIAQTLGVPLPYFFEGLEGDRAVPGASDPVSAAMASPEGAALMAAFAAVRDPATRRHVVELVKSLAPAAPAAPVAKLRTSNGD